MVDTIKAVFVYLIALVIVIGGFVIIYLTRNDGAASEIRLLIAGFIGSALTFVFSSEVQTRTARQSAQATAANQPTVTTTAGPPASVTVTPSNGEDEPLG